ncbi:MAG: hypothetical protein RMJ67_01320 [Elusimicrobiota bacterium]|nr:hypothetical protein [Endomicrobiia bacterium]MDW8165144.1 hypothetical protein [Elusimicrobiota bacterium]
MFSFKEAYYNTLTTIFEKDDIYNFIDLKQKYIFGNFFVKHIFRSIYFFSHGLSSIQNYEIYIDFRNSFITILLSKNNFFLAFSFIEYHIQYFKIFRTSKIDI